MDLKLPSSAGLGKGLWDEHRDFLKVASQKCVFIKSVICDSTTADDLNASLKLIKETDKSAILVLQPNSYEGYDRLRGKLENYKDICMRNDVTACIIPQMHKVVGMK